MYGWIWTNKTRYYGGDWGLADRAEHFRPIYSVVDVIKNFFFEVKATTVRMPGTTLDLLGVGEGSATERSAKDKTILRALKTAGAAGRAENQGDEERAFNFDFLTKLKNMQKILPGTQAYKQAAALKKAAAAAEMAERKKIINAALQSDDYLYGFFNAMVSGLQSRQNVREYVLSAGKSDDLATQISNRYYNYAQTAQAGKKT
ncbi:putative secreted RxLR effector peptide protein [Phytophthora cinnamomi]|uniref:putative secreted RxLR effector peptide protein n=1 Tax=Phytophthora cinnamomi TaxID=4785 RepID=UPI003559ED5C|nr:putative secreted RxLR effector peptide protein [Phytophthora cinnamomi]